MKLLFMGQQNVLFLFRAQVIIDISRSSVFTEEGDIGRFQNIVIKLMKAILKKLKICLGIKKAEGSCAGVS